MAIYDLYSKRQGRLDGKVPDVYVYNEMPSRLRVQIMQIVTTALGENRPETSLPSPTYAYYKLVNDILCREYGINELPHGNYQLSGYDGYDRRIEMFVLSTPDYTNVLDVVEIFLRLICNLESDENYNRKVRMGSSFAEAKDEINERFKEHGVGYQFESGDIIRIDSQLVHAEVVKPALQMLSDAMYTGANDEFLKAHEHYRHSNYKECLNECLKAFESTMKSICDKHGWAYDERATASRLISVCFDNELIPSHLQSQFTSLKAGLESGVPTVRNRMSGHGQGTQQIVVPDYLASYMLHLTATTILLLAKAEQTLQK